MSTLPKRGPNLTEYAVKRLSAKRADGSMEPPLKLHHSTSTIERRISWLRSARTDLYACSWRTGEGSPLQSLWCRNEHTEETIDQQWGRWRPLRGFCTCRRDREDGDCGVTRGVANEMPGRRGSRCGPSLPWAPQGGRGGPARWQVGTGSGRPTVVGASGV
jgi:hypothetical protein